MINETDIEAMKPDALKGGSTEKCGQNAESSIFNRPPPTTTTKPVISIGEDCDHHKGEAMRPETVKSNGGPSSYYDFDAGWTTWNDFMEHKASHQWGAYSIHFKDIGKAMCRFGVKDGTNDAYDARKIIYSGLRLLGMIEGKEAMRRELLSLLDDMQFS